MGKIRLSCLFSTSIGLFSDGLGINPGIQLEAKNTVRGNRTYLIRIICICSIRITVFIETLRDAEHSYLVMPLFALLSLRAEMKEVGLT